MLTLRAALRRLRDSRRRIRPVITRRTILTAAGAATVAITIGLIGTGGSYALWNASTTINAGIVQSGSTGAQVAGFSDLAVTYKAGIASVTHPVTITNSGDVAAHYTMTTTAAVTRGSSSILPAISVTTWKMVGSTCATGAPTGAATWSSLPALTGTIAAGSSESYCFRSTMTTATGVTSGSAIAATVSVKLAVGNWYSTASAIATQTFIDDVAPSTPTGLRTSATTTNQTTIAWTASNDNVGVAGYEIYRNGAKIGTSTAPTFTNTGLTADTVYSYRVTAHDAAGNTSSSSDAASVTTATPPPPPPPPAATSLTCAADGTDNVKLTWSNALGAPKSITYNVYANGVLINSGLSTGNWPVFEFGRIALKAIGLDSVASSAGKTVTVTVTESGQTAVLFTGNVTTVWVPSRIVPQCG